VTRAVVCGHDVQNTAHPVDRITPQLTDHPNGDHELVVVVESLQVTVALTRRESPNATVAVCGDVTILTAVRAGGGGTGVVPVAVIRMVSGEVAVNITRPGEICNGVLELVAVHAQVPVTTMVSVTVCPATATW